MSKTIKVSLPHHTTPAQAKAKIVTGLADARQKYGKHLTQTVDTWTSEDRLEFKSTVLGQTVTGRLHIDAENVNVELDLPMLLSMFANKIRPQIESEGRKLLGP